MAQSPIPAAWPARYEGPRIVSVGQGSTGTHAVFYAMAMLGLPAVHYLQETTARPWVARLTKDHVRTRHKDTRPESSCHHPAAPHGGICHEPSQYPPHDTLVSLYSHAVHCSGGGETGEAEKRARWRQGTKPEWQPMSQSDGSPVCVGREWLEGVERAMEHTANLGYSLSDVPYASLPSLLSRPAFNGSLFVDLRRSPEGWTHTRLGSGRGEKNGVDPVCHPALWPAVQRAGHSPLDLHACVTACIARDYGSPAGTQCLVPLGQLHRLAQQWSWSADWTATTALTRHYEVISRLFSPVATTYSTGIDLDSGATSRPGVNVVPIDLFADVWAPGHVKDGDGGQVPEELLAAVLGGRLCAHPHADAAAPLAAQCGHKLRDGVVSSYDDALATAQQSQASSQASSQALVAAGEDGAVVAAAEHKEQQDEQRQQQTRNRTENTPWWSYLKPSLQSQQQQRREVAVTPPAASAADAPAPATASSPASPDVPTLMFPAASASSSSSSSSSASSSGSSSASPSRPPRVYVYPPADIAMYASCGGTRDLPSWQAKKRAFEEARNATHLHNVDYFFVRAVTAGGLGTGAADTAASSGTASAGAASGVVTVSSPEDAELFVVPALCTQSYDGACSSSHADNAAQLAWYLQASPWFRRHGGADHLLVCDHFAAYKEVAAHVELRSMILGRFERTFWTMSDEGNGCAPPPGVVPAPTNKHCPAPLGAKWRGPVLAVGYTSAAAIGLCPSSVEERRSGGGAMVARATAAALLQSNRMLAASYKNRTRGVTAVMGYQPDKDATRRQLLCAQLSHDARARSGGGGAGGGGGVGGDGDANLVYFTVRAGGERGFALPSCGDGTDAQQQQQVIAAAAAAGEAGGAGGEDQHVGGRIDTCRAFAALGESRFVLHLMGETPTSDRPTEGFEQLTPVAVLAGHKAALIEQLPFGDVVPWRDLLLEVDTAMWLGERRLEAAAKHGALPVTLATLDAGATRRPSQTLAAYTKASELAAQTGTGAAAAGGGGDAAETSGPLAALAALDRSVDARRWAEVVALMARHRDDVLWHTDGSRAAANLLREAAVHAAEARSRGGGSSGAASGLVHLLAASPDVGSGANATSSHEREESRRRRAFASRNSLLFDKYWVG